MQSPISNLRYSKLVADEVFIKNRFGVAPTRGQSRIRSITAPDAAMPTLTSQERMAFALMSAASTLLIVLARRRFANSAAAQMLKKDEEAKAALASGKRRQRRRSKDVDDDEDISYQ